MACCCLWRSMACAILLILVLLLHTATPYTLPTGQPTSAPSQLNANAHQDTSYVCPEHYFLPQVRVDCVNVSDLVVPYIQIHARTSVDFALTYLTQATGENDASTESLLVSMSAFPPDFSSDDAFSYTTVKTSSDAEYVDRLLGVALDGVPIYSALADDGSDMVASHAIKVDACGGSYGNTPDGYRYHYRTIPACVLQPLSSTSTTINSVTTFAQNHFGFADLRQQYITDVHELLVQLQLTAAANAGPQLIGWSITGSPIYTPFTSRGVLVQGLDSCNGKFDPIDGSYAYYTTPTFPYIIGCFGPGNYALNELDAETQVRLPSSPPKACPGGYYLSEDSFASCIKCPAGRYSSASFSRPASSAGSGGAACSSTCPMGHFCPKGSTKPQKCPAGRYGSSLGLADSSCSGSCRAGHFCPPGSISDSSFVCGTITHFCPTGAQVKRVVDLGFFSIPEVEDDARREEQQVCGPGTFCIAGKRFPCPAGRYGSTDGLFSPDCTAPCPQGSYCPEASPQPILCPAGRWGASIAQSSCPDLCEPGYWCPQGSTVPTTVPCKAGRWGGEFGLATEECSPLCEPSGGPNSTDSEGSRYCEFRVCSKGYICPESSTNATFAPCGSPAVYCPPSSVIPTVVDVGYYSIGPLSLPGHQQNDMDATIRDSQAQCEPGYWCANGVREPCAAGLYGETYGLSSALCSGPCAPGFICPIASTSAQQLPCGNGPSVYCPLGSYQPLVVPVGYYSLNGTSTTRSSITTCSSGNYCVQGIYIKCGAGRYSAYGANSSRCDGLCNAGFFCLEGSDDPAQYSCPPGRYGTLGMTNSACRGGCLPGYYCPSNSTTPYAFECGSEYHYCPRRSGAPISVSRGYYSTGGNRTTRIAQVQCPKGDKVYSTTPPASNSRSLLCPSTMVP